MMILIASGAWGLATATTPVTAGVPAGEAPALLKPRSAVASVDPAAPAPSFDQVYAAPDDSSLNVAYAQGQDRAGHLLAAAAAYERILLQQPDDDAVRLLYVDVLIRMDDGTGARREIDKLDPLTLDAGQTVTLNDETARLALADKAGRP